MLQRLGKLLRNGIMHEYTTRARCPNKDTLSVAKSFNST